MMPLYSSFSFSLSNRASTISYVAVAVERDERGVVTRGKVR